MGYKYSYPTYNLLTTTHEPPSRRWPARAAAGPPSRHLLSSADSDAVVELSRLCGLLEGRVSGILSKWASPV